MLHILITDTILAESGPWPGLRFGEKYIFKGEIFLFLSYV